MEKKNNPTKGDEDRKKNKDSAFGTQLPLEDEEGGESEDEEEGGEGHQVDPVVGLGHVELFEELDGRPEVAVGLRAAHVGPLEAVDGQQGALETVAHVGGVRQPAQVRRDRVEGDEEARKEQDRDRRYRTQVHGRLQFHGRAWRRSQTHTKSATSVPPRRPSSSSPSSTMERTRRKNVKRTCQ